MPILLPYQVVIASLQKANLSGPNQKGVATSISKTFSPSVFFRVEFTSKFEAETGNFLPLAVVSSEIEPRIAFLASPIRRPTTSTTVPLYTLICIDTDQPSAHDQSQSPVRHWIRQGLKPLTTQEHFQAQALKTKEHLEKGGVPGEEGVLDMWLEGTRKGSIVSEWVPPCPRIGSGPHRYLFLLYLQNKEQLLPMRLQETIGSNSRLFRGGFDIVKFVAANDLTLVGCNWFYTESLPIIEYPVVLPPTFPYC